MKKAAITMLVVMMMAVLTGCINQANGLILYGEEAKLKQVADTYKDDIKFQNIYNIKKIGTNDKEVLVLSETTARELIRMELWKEVKNDTQLSVLKGMPTIRNESGLLFAKPEDKHIQIAGLDLSYEGNSVIGDSRRYTNAYVVVKDSTFETIKGTMKQMTVMHTKKSMDEELVKIKDYTDAFQLVTLKELK
ncbi:lipoprotein BA_5634 family protein [Paenibacillus sp. SC116]|uniref:lipoprotein BA_5634 family protein n=1 Tax=Paenibacillus sp. SC116 TaxID=2968986 RepID=UPI00215A37AD|nr:lipoprotein BA_5634 family protein [Paenibacillus sp. SC116]MCR8845227.1 lipoprotein BA_5634 family protein [Paenibacillus sp. SC116]